ncbi:MAG TPA: tRNA adenosine(34) deaminase TadA [Deltaproteobacteria bacterium]|nr:tRNA adenosine(34) deaminase TadA [Deltaproteobacteria bacterium]
MQRFSESNPEYFMRKALRLADRAAANHEVPIGAVVVKEGKIIGKGFNRRETRKRPTAHAELLAIEAAAKKLGAWRLAETTLYVTLEPCLMCWGAIILARIPRVVFGAQDPKAGVCGSVLSLHKERRFNHHPQVEGGILEKECGEILSAFFKQLRQQAK